MAADCASCKTTDSRGLHCGKSYISSCRLSSIYLNGHAATPGTNMLSATSAPFRAHVFSSESLSANMATACPRELQSVLQRIDIQGRGREAGPYRCPYCLMEGLSEDGLHAHFPLYHVSEANVTVRCPICATSCEPRSNPFPPHLHTKYVAADLSLLSCLYHHHSSPCV